MQKFSPPVFGHEEYTLLKGPVTPESTSLARRHLLHLPSTLPCVHEVTFSTPHTQKSFVALEVFERNPDLPKFQSSEAASEYWHVTTCPLLDPKPHK